MATQAESESLPNLQQLTPSAEIDLTYKIENQGTINSEKTDISFYLSRDNIIDTNDYLLDSREINSLQSNTINQSTKKLTLPENCDPFWYRNGTYYLGIILDPENNQDEEFKFNNLNQGISIDTLEIKVTNICEKPPMLIINPLEDLITSEQGVTSSFNLSLSSKPISPVTINAESSNISEGTVSPNRLIFTPDDWNKPKKFYITGVPDKLDDGDKDYFINIMPKESNDLNYNNLTPKKVGITNLDFPSFPWQNSIKREDVNKDGQVSPLDALSIINYLNDPINSLNSLLFLDVNNDDHVSPIDALIIINSINQNLFQEGEYQHNLDFTPLQKLNNPKLIPELVDQALTPKEYWYQNKTRKDNQSNISKKSQTNKVTDLPSLDTIFQSYT